MSPHNTSMRHIVYYHLTDMNYASFFIRGFQDNGSLYAYYFTISKQTPAMLAHMKREEVAGILYAICIFKVTIPGNEYYFCVDTRDGCDTGAENGNGYCLPLLSSVRFYFKVNYNPAPIATNPELGRYAEKIIPINPFIPVKPRRPLSFLPALLPQSPQKSALMNSLKKVRDLLRIMDLESLKALRHTAKDIDIFFVVKYYHPAIHETENRFRLRIMQEIKKYPHIRAITGFTSKTEIPGEYAEYRIKPYSLFEYMRSVSRGKVALYVRGVHDCLSFKFGQLLAMGMPVSGQSIFNNRELLYRNQYFAEQFAYDTPEEIVRNAVALIENQERLALLARSNADVFDALFTPGAVTADILKYQELL